MVISEVFNEDCMIGMARYPDKFFDLAIVDPPYGINAYQGTNRASRKQFAEKTENWDSDIPKADYFSELFRVSKNQIIWGGNYFLEHIGSTRGFIIWDKLNPDRCFADCEFAWSSIDSVARIIKLRPQTVNKKDGGKIHPTQKPTALYAWILNNYATCEVCNNTGGYYEDVVGDGGSKMYIACEDCDSCERRMRILDTHLGSGSSRIASYKLGFDFYGWEINREYFQSQNERFIESINEPLFNNPEQTKLL